MKKLLLFFLLIVIAIQCASCNTKEAAANDTGYNSSTDMIDESNHEANSENLNNEETVHKTIRIKRQISAHRVIAEYRYDESGNILSKTTYTYDNNDNTGVDSTTDYQYDNNELTKATTTWKSGTVEETVYDYVYNENGDVTTKYEYFTDFNGTIINTKTIFDYDSDGRVAREWKGTSDQTPSDEDYTYCEYDDSGNLTATRNKKPLVNYLDEEYEYDEDNLLTIKFTRDSSGQLKSVYRYSYNDNNDLIKVTENRYEDNGEESGEVRLVEQYEYEYY